MPTIRVFEPALCCNTGVCGPDVDEALVAFTADLKHLDGLGVDIQRHNLATDPQAFADNDTVRAYLQGAGSGGLPLTLVDGVTVATGTYPCRAQLLRYAQLDEPTTEDGAAGHAAANEAASQARVVPAGVTTALTMAPPADQSCSGDSGCC